MVDLIVVKTMKLTNYERSANVLSMGAAGARQGVGMNRRGRRRHRRGASIGGAAIGSDWICHRRIRK